MRLSHAGWKLALTPMSFATRMLLALVALVLIAQLVFSGMVYDDLPARIPVHFNAAGTPDRFGPRSNWWFLPMVCVGSTALTVGSALLLPRRPDLLNLPSKQEILQLPREAQSAVVRQAQPALLGLALLVAVLMLYLQFTTWNIALGRAASFRGSVLLVLPLLTLLLLPAMLVPVNRELRRQQRAIRPT
jgi:hypothetical protein